MRVLFLYPEVGTTVYGSVSLHMGLASLSGYIREKGHVPFVLRVGSADKKSLLQRVKAYKPDIVGITSGTNQWHYAKQFGQWVKEAIGVPVIYGGWHVTLVPEEAISLPHTDYVCIGDGELPFAELLERLATGRPTDDIKGLWVKKGEKIFRNPMSPLIEDLDVLPFMDLEAQEFDRLPYHISLIEGFRHTLEINAGRGCPFSCTFCCAKAFRNMHEAAGVGRYVRVRSPRRVIEELKYHIRKYPFIDSVRFYDDTFVLSKKWLGEFLPTYIRDVNLPFFATARADTVDDEILGMLEAARCAVLAYGLETGNEELRCKLSHKGVTNEQLRNAFTLSKKHGIRVWALTMIGLPFETRENYLETRKMISDFVDIIDICSVSVFNPYPGSDAIQTCAEHGWLTERAPSTFANGATIEMPFFPGAEIEQCAQELRQSVVDLFCRKKQQGYLDLAAALDSAEKTTSPGLKVQVKEFFSDCPEPVWIYAHPPAKIKYSNVDIREHSDLAFGIGVAVDVYDLPGGGAEFAIAVDGEVVFRRRLDPRRREQDREWFFHSIPLDKYVGGGRTIEFTTSAFGRGRGNYCPAGWGRPHIRQRASVSGGQ